MVGVHDGISGALGNDKLLAGRHAADRRRRRTGNGLEGRDGGEGEDEDEEGDDEEEDEEPDFLNYWTDPPLPTGRAPSQGGW